MTDPTLGDPTLGDSEFLASDSPDLPALLGSRICHDLISPLGAIGNGVELLGMSGTLPGPEMELIADSVASANARVRFFRVAFGAAAPDQRIGRPEVMQILTDMMRGARLTIDWQVPGDPVRGEVKMAFLAIQCLETALPFGGTICVALQDGHWRIEGSSSKIKVIPEIWQWLSQASPGPALTAAQVQFALLPEEAARRGRVVSTEIWGTGIAIKF